ncbi:MAG: DUF2807 domain-containing protein [Cryomorphaceae bacterium]
MQNLELRIVSSICLLCALVFTGCEKESASCLEGRGNQTEEIRNLSGFSDLHVTGRIDVNLVPDSTDYVRVVYGENGIGGIHTQVTDGTLSISEINRCDWFRKVEPLPMVEVHYARLSGIFSQSAGAVRFLAPFRADSIRIEIEDAAGSLEFNGDCERIDLLVHTGATDVILKGECTRLFVYNSGYAPVDAKELVTRTAIVHNNGSSDTYVHAWENVYTQIYHIGNIYVSGNAQITRWHEKGGGSVVLVDD